MERHEIRVEFYGVDLYGNPVKKTYSLPPDPSYWPTRPSSILVRVLGKVNEHIIEKAQELGWGFNPHTQTFYRLD